jgi:iron-sulfur cluster assembly protein
MTEPTQTETPLILTEAAAAKIFLLLEDEPESDALRVAVTGGGCSGFQYALGTDSVAKRNADDELFVSLGVSVLVDEQSLDYLEGSTVDFSDTLSESGFKVENPNATGTCGCGQSFYAEDAPCRS